MCKFQIFHLRCGCDRIKIAQPCNATSVNVQGITFCRHDPHPHLNDDSKTRQYVDPGYGPGICDNVHCKWRWGILPPGMFEEDVKKAYRHEVNHSVNDVEFDMSEAAKSEREFRWFALLTNEQKWDLFKEIKYPLPEGNMSLYARAYFNPDIEEGQEIVANRYYELRSVELHWSELNPRYLTAEQLQHATGLFLPAEVTIPGNPEVHGSTPHKPRFGPFAVSKDHECSRFPGVCDGCGKYIGNAKLAEGHTTNDRADALKGPERNFRRTPRIRLDEPEVHIDIYGEGAMEGVERT